MINKEVKVITVILVIASITVATLFLARPRTEPTAVERPLPRVTTTTLQQTPLSPILELYGTVESPQRVNVKAPVTTYVMQTPFLEGDTVKAGERMITLDLRDPTLLVQTREGDVKELQGQINSEKIRYTSDIASLKNEKQLVHLKRNVVQREAHLVKTKVGSLQRKEQAEQELRAQELQLQTRTLAVEDHQYRLASLEAKLTRAQASLAQAKLDLQRAAMPAPFTGRIISLTATVGDRITAGQVIISLFNTTEIEIRAQVPHQAISLLNQALKETARLQAWTEVHGQKLNLLLDRLASEVNTRRAGVDALFSIDEQNAIIPLGHTIPIYLKLQPREDAYAVPITAIYDEQRLYRIIDGKLERIQIERLGYVINANQQRLALIKSPQLGAGDVILTSQLSQVANGMQVAIIHSPESDKDAMDGASPADAK